MDVQMFRNARAGNLAQIDADVEAVGFHHRRQRVDATARELPQIRQFLLRQAVQVGDLFVRHDQQMSAVVGIGIEQGETGAVAHDDAVRLVVIGLRDAGEQAGVELWLGREDVFNPPRCVQRFHGGRVEVETQKVKTV